jgi:hypothetical protein
MGVSKERENFKITVTKNIILKDVSDGGIHLKIIKKYNID